MTNTAQSKRKVVVAMSGGVDSSVAAALLVDQGFEVIGVTMQIWPEATGDEGDVTRACCSLSAVEDARRVAAQLGIPHYVMNFKDEFQTAVIADFIEEYKRGRTPNPCIRCNRFVKFEALLDKARAIGADCIATGHYSRIVHEENRERWLLKRAFDRSKDQSYALYAMTQFQLAHTLMPLADIPKTETRRLAAKLGLTVANKPDSQEICFVENRNYPGFLRTAAPETVKPGPIRDMAGNEIGRHEGIAFYTVGQRKRLGVSSPTPLYVARIEAAENAIVVGQDSDLYASNLIATHLNFISIAKLEAPFAVSAKIRYNTNDSPALLTPIENERALVEFQEPQRAVTPGQAVVFYDGEDLVGGGVIELSS